MCHKVQGQLSYLSISHIQCLQLTSCWGWRGWKVTEMRKDQSETVFENEPINSSLLPWECSQWKPRKKGTHLSLPIGLQLDVSQVGSYKREWKQVTAHLFFIAGDTCPSHVMLLRQSILFKYLLRQFAYNNYIRAYYINEMAPEMSDSLIIYDMC